MELYNYRHSMAHILAQAVQRTIEPSVKLGVGPVIDNGFYYDFYFQNQNINNESLKDIQKQINKIIKENQDFISISTTPEFAKKINTKLWQDLKNELIDEFVEENQSSISFSINTIDASLKDKVLKDIDKEYINFYEEITKFAQENFDFPEDKFITFMDMCRLGHVENTKEIEPKWYKLTSIAWAYRRWDENNSMMTRIYWYAFTTKDELQEYLNFLEEARKRDHRVLGKTLKIFTNSDLVGAGLPMLQPNWMIIRKQLEDYLRKLHKDKWYDRVWTPHLAKEDLYKTSGHWEKFWDELLKTKWKYWDLCMKPMNCPHHMQIFADNNFSYRDLPVRYFEPATVYRDEKPWELGGLTRVRAINQDDGHLFCRVSQIKQEVKKIVEIIFQFYTKIGLIESYRVRLSLRGEDTENYLGSEERWQTSQNALEEIAQEEQLKYYKEEWEAAFYGPKLDFMFKDSLDRERQLATIQLDFNLPERFDLTFINEQWEKERPVVIHRAICGSFERFMAIMIEHFAGAFPFWLAPVQVNIVPVTEKFNEYGEKVKQVLERQDVRTELDHSDDSFNKKIRNSQTRKIPYTLIVWENEENNLSVSVREYWTNNQYEIQLEEFISSLDST